MYMYINTYIYKYIICILYIYIIYIYYMLYIYINTTEFDTSVLFNGILIRFLSVFFVIKDKGNDFI